MVDVTLIDELYEVQVASSFPIEVAAFWTNPRWRAARTVVDLGCASGAFTRRVAETFTGKHFLGVDIDQRLVDLAQRHAHPPCLKYRTEDVFSLSGSFDFVIARALVQHLRDIPKFAKKLNELVSGQGGALVMDRPDTQAVFHWPPLPEFALLYEEIAEAQKRSRGDRSDPLDSLGTLLADAGARISVRTVGVPSSIHDNLALFERQHALVINALAGCGYEAQGLEDARQALLHWQAHETRFVQLGLKLLEIEF